MRKLLLFCLVLLIGCSGSDDSNSNSNQDLIIGVWKPIKEVDVCVDGSQTEAAFDSCEQTSRYTFQANNNLAIIVYASENSGCQLDSDEQGQWEIIGEILKITIGGETNEPTIFELTNSTLSIGYFDNDPNDPCSSSVAKSHYYTQLTRVQ